ncbi:MAG: hemerythrin domain-containing protein [Euryarchaeota archaeon]|nr:hemerythrin domain-containing protein [Euryarchaeota archaeon]MDE1837885.1 hemerythrin domain-containing protein [Euryarchaeota archaeon]MDE1881644.1 hemerythrin domain-containing protein [Euryarchaeota archaeon]MDE2046231.1 hemerythrin domain-containing protein [Thermoplasmata archaeon]
MTNTELTDPLEELQHENEVTQGLLERILEEAQILKGGKDLPPGEIAEGLRLLEQYRHIHVQRMDGTLGPEARAVAMSTCTVHLDQLPKDHGEVSEVLENAKKALARYERGVASSRDALAHSLESLGNRTFEVRTHEGDYPLSCLVSALPEGASKRLAEKFTTDRANVEDLESHIQRLLASPAGSLGAPLSVHCARDGCVATAEGRVVPLHEGRIGLMAPEGGWGVSPQTTRLGSDGVVRVRVDFLCPEHARGSGSEDPAPLALAAWADEGGHLPHSPRDPAFPASMLAAPSQEGRGRA